MYSPQFYAYKLIDALLRTLIYSDVPGGGYIAGFLILGTILLTAFTIMDTLFLKGYDLKVKLLILLSIWIFPPLSFLYIAERHRIKQKPEFKSSFSKVKPGFANHVVHWFTFGLIGLVLMAVIAYATLFFLSFGGPLDDAGRPR